MTYSPVGGNVELALFAALGSRRLSLMELPSEWRRLVLIFVRSEEEGDIFRDTDILGVAGPRVAILRFPPPRAALGVSPSGRGVPGGVAEAAAPGHRSAPVGVRAGAAPDGSMCPRDCCSR